MLLDLDTIIKQYNMVITGVLHIGAHFGEEYGVYQKNGITDLIFFEPVPNTFQKLTEKLDGKAILINKALGNTEGKISMNLETANDGQSNSILQPALHLKQYPHIKFEDTVEVDITTLDNFMGEFFSNKPIDGPTKFNMINIDVQGYELEVFKGAEKTLENIDYIITEVNRDVVYHQCAFVDDLDEFLGKYNFKRVETTWDGGTWGDALYVKG